MMSALRLDPKECAVLVIDAQERLFSVMPELAGSDLLRAGNALLEGAYLLGAVAIATEQYPEKLGGTLTPIAEKLDSLNAPRIPKLDFSACREGAFINALAKTERRSVIVLGMETHICVFQTVRDLCIRGYNVHVPIDGVASRRDDHRQTGLELCRAAGAVITTAETILFDWTVRAGSETFKRVSKLIK
ncbi:MAG: isochorismatase family protein [Polyangiaceae bacterium]|nr:isochorismatase family protein [Polyangiaceae bacterium]